MLRHRDEPEPAVSSLGFLSLILSPQRPVLNRLRGRVDNRRYNGAALLGLRGVVIKSHGSADAYAYGFALQRAREAVVSKLLERTAQTVVLITQRSQLGDAAAGETAAAGNTV